jgi:hypothetical protein
MVNLYKLGRHPWSEALVYLTVIVLALTLGRAALAQAGLAAPMVAAGILMAVLAVPALHALLRRDRDGG